METIAAISTAPGQGAISIVRMSGPDSLMILNNIFNREVKPFMMTYGRIEGIDEVMVCYMKSPRTYTREDIVEIYAHGNYLIAQNILKLLVQNGARLADRGEFTKRAFLNGRIDLTQAESVLDLINSKSNRSIDLSLKNLSGFLRDKVRDIRGKIISAVANVNAISDYPEEVEDSFDRDSIIEVIDDIGEIISSYTNGRKIKEGVKVAIIGSPNVGKSSIMNRLLKFDRAIVTDVEGTTRDLIEDRFFIDGFPIVILDTAGIRESKDRVEKIGIELAKSSMKDADLILFVIDSSREMRREEIDLYDSIKNKNHITILNKSDISKIDFPNAIKISALKGDISELESKILEKSIDRNHSECIINNLRHRDLFERCKLSLESFLSSSAPIDVSSVFLNEALRYLGEIVGEVTTEDLLDNIFKNFCVGK